MIVLAIIARDLFTKQLMFTSIVASTVLLFQIVLLFSYIKKTNRLFTRFILAISNRDFASKFEEDYIQSPYQGLNIAFNKILDQYKDMSMEKEKQYFLTKNLIESIPAGVLVFNELGKITFKNKLGEKLLGIAEIYSMDQLKSTLGVFGKKLDEHTDSGSFLYDSDFGNETKKLAVTVKTIHLFKQKQKLISIQDVSKELDAGELDAIQKLMRVLTHEIMNSLTPINSLTETVMMLMSDSEGKEKLFDDFSSKNYQDVRESVIAIKERGEGLDYFIQNFRSLTKLPEKLKKENIYIKDLFNSVCKIMNAETNNLTIKTKLQEDITIKADAALIEQVIINLLKNSLDAVSGIKNPKVLLEAFMKDSTVIIQVVDNGIGIPKTKISQVFIPFYTTKVKGSGIGLSFARQIMSMHNGSINIQSELNKETVVRLKF